MTAGLPLLKSALIPLAKSILLGLSAGISVADAAIQKKIYSLRAAALIVSNEQMKAIMKIVKSLEESLLLIKELVKQLKMKQEIK